jgi:hypothetical protein
MTHYDQLDASLRSRPLYPVVNLAIASIRLVIPQRHAQRILTARRRHRGRVSHNGLVGFSDQLHREQDFGLCGLALQALQRRNHAAPSELDQVLSNRGAQLTAAQARPASIRRVVPYRRKVLVTQIACRLDCSQRHLVINRKHSPDACACL